MVEFFCPHCKQNTLDSFAVGLAHGRVLKCDFCMNEFTVSIVAAEQKRVLDLCEVCPNYLSCPGIVLVPEDWQCAKRTS